MKYKSLYNVLAAAKGKWEQALNHSRLILDPKELMADEQGDHARLLEGWLTLVEFEKLLKDFGQFENQDTTVSDAHVQKLHGFSTTKYASFLETRVDRVSADDDQTNDIRQSPVPH